MNRMFDFVEDRVEERGGMKVASQGQTLSLVPGPCSLGSELRAAFPPYFAMYVFAFLPGLGHRNAPINRDITTATCNLLWLSDCAGPTVSSWHQQLHLGCKLISRLWFIGTARFVWVVSIVLSQRQLTEKYVQYIQSVVKVCVQKSNLANVSDLAKKLKTHFVAILVCTHVSV